MAKGKKSGGRKAGTPNKLTSTFKQLVMTTLDDLQSDRRANLKAWAKENPTEFYKIASKLIPTEITARVTNTANILDNYTEAQIDQLIEKTRPDTISGSDKAKVSA